MSSNGLVVHGWPQHRGLAFGRPVEQTAPVKYLNPLIPCGASFNSPFSDVHFKNMPVNVVASHESEQSELPGSSYTPGAYQQIGQNTKALTGQSEIRIDRVWSMAGDANAHLYAINANHPPPTATLTGTVGNNVSGSGEFTSQSLSVADVQHTPDEPLATIPDKTYQKGCTRSEKMKAYQKTYRQSEKGKAYYRAFFKAYRQSEKGKAYYKAYRRSEKYKAYRKAYQRSYRTTNQKANEQSSEPAKAAQRIHEESVKLKAFKKDCRKAYVRNYQKAYRKAYYPVLKNTGDIEKARIAGRQATAFVKEANRARKMSLKQTPLPSPPARFSS